MENIKSTLGTLLAQFKDWFLIIIGFVGVIYAGQLIIKAMGQFKDANMKEGLKSVAYAILVALLAVGGIAFVWKLGGDAKNDNIFKGTEVTIPGSTYSAPLIVK